LGVNEEFIAEVLRLNARFIDEVVEAYNVCPFSRTARARGEVVRSVLLQKDRAVEPSLAELDRLTEGRPEVAVAIVIYPLIGLGSGDFDRFVQDVRAADQLRATHAGGQPAFAAASFHPEYRLMPRSPATMVPFFRRSPDPAIQFVRLSTLDQVRGERGTIHFDYTAGGLEALMRHLEKVQVSVTERIAEQNYALVREHGPAVLEAIYDDIQRDRRESYARFGVR
jgi:hypothetical protein